MPSAEYYLIGTVCRCEIHFVGMDAGAVGKGRTKFNTILRDYHLCLHFVNSITWPQTVRFHYFKVYYGALVEENLGVYVIHK